MTRMTNAALIAALTLAALVATTVGATSLGSPLDVLTGNVDSAASTILWEIRIPRVVTAILAGALVAIAGAIAQGVFSNPIAEPTLIGTTASAALGAVLIIAVTGGGAPVTIAAAFAAALLASLATLRLASRRDLGIAALVVVGVAIAAIANGILTVVAAIADNAEIRSVGFWTSGTLAFADWGAVQLLAPLLIATALWAPRAADQLDLLGFGDIQVRLLGRSPMRIRFIALAVVSAITAVATVNIGSLAFLGLAAPHITRFLVGHSHRQVLPTTALVGAALLLVADTAARTLIAPAELPISVVTALVGAPFLIALMVRPKERA